MKLAFLIFKYFPFGGAQRDCMKIARACTERGHEVCIFTRTWEGELPDSESIQVRTFGKRGLSNVAQDRWFISQARKRLANEQMHGVVGFNRMPGLDVYFCADTPWGERIAGKPFWIRWVPRYRFFLEMEEAVFGPASPTQILMLLPRDIPFYQKYYGATGRFHVLPPGIDRFPYSESDRQSVRARVRREFALPVDAPILLFVGSGFRTKGLIRAIRAVAALNNTLRHSIQFVVIGQGDTRSYRRCARQLGVADRVHFLGGREDVRQFYLAADCLVHPAVRENTGTVLIEAIASGLPVLATAACGYAFHVEQADAGIVLPEPFDQTALDRALPRLLDPAALSTWRSNALKYAATQDLYSQSVKAAEVIEQTIKSNASVVS